MLTLKILNLIRIKPVPFVLGLFALFLGSSFWTVRAWSESGVPLPDGFRQVTVGEYFTCAVPRDWREDSYPLGLSAEEKKVYGMSFYGPRTQDGSIMISAHFYAIGNLVDTFERYIKVHSDGPIEARIVSGISARVFENHTYSMRTKAVAVNPGVYIRPGLNAEQVSIRERFVVIPVESGYYALRYSAPAERYQDFIEVFEKMTDSFVAKK